MIIPVVITVSDRSFTFIMKTPPVSVLQEGRWPADGEEAGRGLEGAEQEQGRQSDDGSGSRLAKQRSKT
jgi:hypothetical protein